jgi:hypothetical protein
MPQFTDENIERIFGADDAENENPVRFKEYFYKNRAYEALTSDLPVRVLVGHKGVGKSALLKHAFLSDEETRKPAVWMKPNALVAARSAASKEQDFILRIEEWKLGILRNVLDHHWRLVYGEGASEVINSLESYNPNQLSQLLTRSLKENARGNPINIYIDDIDRGWSATPNDVRNISALLNAIRDIGGEHPSIRFRIGLRSDVYFLVRTSDESTDKIERNVIWLRWTNDDILRVLGKRVATFFNMQIAQSDIDQMTQRQISENILSNVIDPKYKGRGRWENRPTYTILMSLTRARPRDLVKLFHASAKNAFAEHSEIITSKQLEGAFEAYSQERLQDIVNEFKSELPEIERLLFEMRPTKRERHTSENYLFTNDALNQKLRNAMDHVNLRFNNGKTVSPASLAQFLYKIDFITARKVKENGFGIDRKYFDQNRFLANEFLDFGYDWEIHPAYRWALQPQNVIEILDGLDA